MEHYHREGQLVDHKPNNPQEIPHTRCHLLPIRDFCPNKEINKHKYFLYLTRLYGVMKLKKDDTGLLQLALLVSQDFIIKYYQVMLKLPFIPT